MKESGYSSTILDLGTIWIRVVTFTPRPLYPWGNHPWYPLNKRLGGPQSLFGRYGEGKALVPSGKQTPAVQRVACRYTESVINEEDAKMK
jgi:hypothetical protein